MLICILDPVTNKLVYVRFGGELPAPPRVAPIVRQAHKEMVNQLNETRKSQNELREVTMQMRSLYERFNCMPPIHDAYEMLPHLPSEEEIILSQSASTIFSLS